MTVDEMIKRVRTEMFYMLDGQNVGLQIAMALEAAKQMRDSYAYCEIIKKERWIVGEWNDAIKAWDSATSDDESKCEICRHDEFDTVHGSGDPEPGYRCKKCGYIHWI